MTAFVVPRWIVCCLDWNQGRQQININGLQTDMVYIKIEYLELYSLTKPIIQPLWLYQREYL
jgi:hypothetical protein